MDNYLSLKERGLTKRKKFISQREIGYGEVSLPSHPSDCSANDDSFFPFIEEALNLNYLIV